MSDLSKNASYFKKFGERKGYICSKCMSVFGFAKNDVCMNELIENGRFDYCPSCGAEVVYPMPCYVIEDDNTICGGTLEITNNGNSYSGECSKCHGILTSAHENEIDVVLEWNNMCRNGFANNARRIVDICNNKQDEEEK